MYEQSSGFQGEQLIAKADYNYNAQAPPGPPPPPPPAVRNSNVAIRKYLTSNGWPTGLQDAFIAGTQNCPVRYFICDDSGSMMSSDGHRVVGEGSQAKVVSCNRWSELTETLRFHINAAAFSSAPTEFRLLNGAQPISIGSSSESDEVGLPILLNLLEGSPGGGTPLCYHVGEVVSQITKIAPELRAAGKKAALIICTDGEASDGEITNALQPLHNLPVWVVIRLCTDENTIVNYWNNVDDQIELNMDVIDDPLGEGQQIQSKNDWLTYGLPLHRLREFGVTMKEIDMIDESSLSAEQMKSFCCLLFGVKNQDLPHPEADWLAFSAAISLLNDKEPLVWNSIAKKPTKWINMSRLTHTYGRNKQGGKQGNSGGKDIGDACCTVA